MRYDRDYVERRYREERDRAAHAECPELADIHARLAAAFGAQLDIIDRPDSFYATGLAMRRAAAR
nr:hypothetical protein [Sphingomonas laterariae]